MSFSAIEWAYKQTVGGLIEKAVLLALANRVNNGNGECFPGIDTIASDCEGSRRAIMRAIVRLEESGFLQAERVCGRATRYVLATSWIVQTSDLKITSDSKITSDLNGTRPVSFKTLDQCPLRHPNQETNQERNQEEKTPIPPAPKLAKATTRQATSEELTNFDRFWLAYPKKNAKPAALKAWKASNADNLVDLIISDVTRRRLDDRQWAEKQYIPYPATYLNQRRWEDEIPTAQPGAKNERPNRIDAGREMFEQFAVAAGYGWPAKKDGSIICEVLPSLGGQMD